MLQHVLAVGDDELAVRDDDDASSEVAEGGHVWVSSGNSRGWISGSHPASRLRFTGIPVDRGNRKMT